MQIGKEHEKIELPEPVHPDKIAVESPAQVPVSDPDRVVSAP